ncbi:nitrilase [Rhizobium mesoamericanum]|uniref:carbon-nitrogen hydrolase family protein n=1 Tax=Rhizobium mesoamericanum TaxID=1079800 RepID=UPI0027853595|nr:carbon-nitrogen hydrolase family protein [Rhizobium mesoamericanum]MDQ0561883.1 nitrilase [Rhizobium mesoamericanum]
MKVALIQMNSQPNRKHNLVQALRLMSEAMLNTPHLIVLPEHFDWMGGTAEDKRRAADLVPGGEAYCLIQQFAKDHGVWVHAGSLLERSQSHGAVHNTTVVFNSGGEHVGHYRKIHLFDITAPNGATYAESAVVTPGEDLLIYEMNGYKIACAICYDLRFSRLFDRLSSENVDVFILPAAFTRQTGRAHWEVLCRARAIEYQAYFVACGQCGSYPAPSGPRRQTFGRSLVSDPWGTVIARAGQYPTVLHAEINPHRLTEVRHLIPMSQHRVLLEGTPLHVKAERA